MPADHEAVRSSQLPAWLSPVEDEVGALRKHLGLHQPIEGNLATSVHIMESLLEQVPLPPDNEPPAEELASYMGRLQAVQELMSESSLSAGLDAYECCLVEEFRVFGNRLSRAWGAYWDAVLPAVARHRTVVEIPGGGKTSVVTPLFYRRHWSAQANARLVHGAFVADGDTQYALLRTLGSGACVADALVAASAGWTERCCAVVRDADVRLRKAIGAGTIGGMRTALVAPVPGDGRSGEAQQHWSSARQGGMPVIGWRPILKELKIPWSRGAKDRIHRLNARTHGPIGRKGRRPAVDRGCLKAWIESTDQRASDAASARANRTVTLHDLGKRGGHRAGDFGMSLRTRVNAPPGGDSSN